MHEGVSGDLSLGAETVSLLERYGFDRKTFELLRQKLASGELGDASNRLPGSVEPPAAGDVRTLPALGTSERAALALTEELLTALWALVLLMAIALAATIGLSLGSLT